MYFDCYGIVTAHDHQNPSRAHADALADHGRYQLDLLDKRFLRPSFLAHVAYLKAPDAHATRFEVFYRLPVPRIDL